MGDAKTRRLWLRVPREAWGATPDEFARALGLDGIPHRVFLPRITDSRLPLRGGDATDDVRRGDPIVAHCCVCVRPKDAPRVEGAVPQSELSDAEKLAFRASLEQETPPAIDDARGIVTRLARGSARERANARELLIRCVRRGAPLDEAAALAQETDLA